MKTKEEKIISALFKELEKEDWDAPKAKTVSTKVYKRIAANFLMALGKVPGDGEIPMLNLVKKYKAAYSQYPEMGRLLIELLYGKG